MGMGVTQAARRLQGWHRPVGWRTLLGVSALILSVWLALMSAGMWWMHERWQALVALNQLPVGVSLPKGIAANALVASTLHTRLDMDARISLPVDQIMRVTVQGLIQAHTIVRADIPVATTVSFEAEVPVVTEVQAQVPVLSWLPAMTVNLPASVMVPLKVSVPVRLNYPVTLDLNVTAEIPQALQVPVHTRVHATVPLHADLLATVTRQAEFRLDEAVNDVPMMIERTQVKLPFRDVSWQLRAKAP
jgi:hypothetical protein